MDNFTPTDAIALQRSNGYGDDMWGGNGVWWLLILFALFAGGNGWGNNRNNDNGAWALAAMQQGSLTRADLCQEFNFNNLENGVRGLERGICDLGYASLNQTNQLAAQIAESRFAQQNCCCETNRNIDSLRFQSERNACDIVNAIHVDGEATRALINANTMQDLRDKLADRDRDLQTANFQLSQQAQNTYLVNQLRPCPIPAYLSCSPYQSFPNGYGNGFGFSGNACGCNNGCGC